MTAAPSKLSEDHVTVDISDGWINLVSSVRDRDDADDDAGTDALVDEALDGGLWLAQRPGEILVVPNRQTSWERPLTVERWDAEPPDDSASWQDVCEASIAVDEGGLFWVPIPDPEGVRLPVPPGADRVRLSGRNIAPPDSDDETDVWRLQLWHEDQVAAPRRISRPAW